MRAHREGRDKAALDKMLRIMTHDVAVFAGGAIDITQSAVVLERVLGRFMYDNAQKQPE